ncbi:hypothetical protein SORBI_3004G138600 [Sorghum bicolor]|uniref:Uncharacterized protein n=1 Tax=Sorghum bicolor TaxID=4558 RepID=A0A194YPN1_SORBI|nr:hypothetical protein SORBI_3004G138600 [Sorghum bicolor]
MLYIHVVRIVDQLLSSPGLSSAKKYTLHNQGRVVCYEDIPLLAGFPGARLPVIFDSIPAGCNDHTKLLQRMDHVKTKVAKLKNKYGDDDQEWDETLEAYEEMMQKAAALKL